MPSASRKIVIKSCLMFECPKCMASIGEACIKEDGTHHQEYMLRLPGLPYPIASLFFHEVRYALGKEEAKQYQKRQKEKARDVRNS